jgi:hypothetical protein
VWQTAEVLYFLAIWWYLVTTSAEDGKGLTPQWYAAATFLHVVVTLWFAGLVVRDILRPEHDVVRTDGEPDDEDDPGGGPLDRAPDRVTIPPARRRRPAADEPDSVQAEDGVEPGGGEARVGGQGVADGGDDAAAGQPEQ